MINYYIVGGYLRDEMLGVRSKDLDFAVEAPSYEAMREDILAKDMIIYQERPEYLAIRGRHPKFGGVDFTLCRKDGLYKDYRHPNTVEIGTIYDDLARRDFTVNAMARDESGLLIDPYGGVDDLHRNILRCVGSADARFGEDALRLLRAVRFHLVRGFALDPQIALSLMDTTILNGLKKIPVERAYEELKTCFEHDSYKTMQFLRSHWKLEQVIFKDLGLELSPRIP